MNLRLSLLAAVFAAAGALLTARVVYIQLIDDAHYREEARQEHFGQQEVRAPRGAILDRHGHPLATTVDAFDIYIDRGDWRDLNAATRAAEFIAPIIEWKPEELLVAVRKEESGLFLAYSGLDFEEGAALDNADAPGLRVVQTTTRSYPEGDLLSMLLGFVGRDHTGLTGIERDFDRELGGVPGTIYFERDSIGNRIALGSERIGRKPQPGGDVRLTIDRYIQRIVEQELDARITSTGALGGTIIVMDPETGAVLAMASRPGFDVSKLKLNDDIDHSLLRNRAVTDAYEPGSIFKTLTAAMAIDQGLVNPESTYFDEGYVQIDNSVIRNWDQRAHGTVTVRQLLQRSLNVGAVWLSGKVGPDRFYSYMRDFGIGRPTGVGIGGENEGTMRDPESPDWTRVDLATNAFGQGIAASPLQVITAVASLVNGGKLMRPYVVQEADTPEGRRAFAPVMVRQVVKPETADVMVDMMHEVVHGVPGHLAAVKGYAVGGKTGTTTGAVLADGDVRDGNIASFIGFAPVDDPKMIMLVKLDVREDRLGGQIAAPVFSALAPSILAYLGVAPEDPVLVTAGP